VEDISIRLWYGEASAISNAIDYAKFRSRSHRAVIRVDDEVGNVIEPPREKQAWQGFPTEAFDLFLAALCFVCVSTFYLLWNVRTSANLVELLIFVTNHGSGPIPAVTCS
jgi:hypothetical protein